MPNWYLIFETSAIDDIKQVKEGIFILKDKKPDILFYNEVMAHKHAEKLASEHPGKLIQVFKAVEVFEASKAPIIHKVYNENGELVPR